MIKLIESGCDGKDGENSKIVMKSSCDSKRLVLNWKDNLSRGSEVNMI